MFENITIEHLIDKYKKNIDKKDFEELFTSNNLKDNLEYIL